MEQARLRLSRREEGIRYSAPISPRKRYGPRPEPGLRRGSQSAASIKLHRDRRKPSGLAGQTLSSVLARTFGSAYDAALRLGLAPLSIPPPDTPTTPDNGIPSKQRVCTVRRHKQSKSCSNRRVVQAAPFPKFNLPDIHLLRPTVQPEPHSFRRQLSPSVELPVLGPLHHGARPKPIDTCKTRTYPDGAY